jgi:hypothetical protein
MSGGLVTHKNHENSTYENDTLLQFLLDFNMLDLELDRQGGQCFFDTLDTIVKDPEVPAPYKDFCHRFLNRRGHRGGLKLVSTRQLFETGVPDQLGGHHAMGDANEFGTFDEKMFDGW